MTRVDERTRVSRSRKTADSRLEFLSHEPIISDTQDKLGYSNMATAIASVIRDRATVTPLTIAISAPWGVGKTSLANLVEEQLRADTFGDKASAQNSEESLPEPLIIWFNAWTHGDAPNLGAAFGSAVARDLGRERTLWSRLRRPLATSMLTSRQRVVRELTILLVAATVAIVAALVGQDFFVEQVEGVDWLAGLKTSVDRAWGEIAVTVFVVGWGSLTLWTRVATGTRAIAKFFDDPEAEASKGTISEVRRRLKSLVTDAQNRGAYRRIVIFVDDLERTTPPRAVDVCEVSSQLLDFEGVITVFVADMPAIAAAAQAKHGGAAGGYQPRDGLGGWAHKDRLSYGRLFLQKLVQFQVDLPPTTTEMALKVAFPPVSARSPSSKKKRLGGDTWNQLRTRVGKWGLTGRVAILVGLGTLAVWLFIVALRSESWTWAWWCGVASLIVLVVVLAASLIESTISLPGRKRSPRQAGILVVSLAGLGAAWVWLFIVALGSVSWTWAWWAGVVLTSVIVTVLLVLWVANVTTSLARSGQPKPVVAGRIAVLLALSGFAVWLFVVAVGSVSWTWVWWVGFGLTVTVLVLLALWVSESGGSAREVLGLMTMLIALGIMAVWLYAVALGSVSWTWAWWTGTGLIAILLILLTLGLALSERPPNELGAVFAALAGLVAIAAWLFVVAIGSTSWTWAWWVGLVALVSGSAFTAWFEWKGRRVASADEGTDAHEYPTTVWGFAGAIALSAATAAFLVWLLIVALYSESWSWAWWFGFGWAVMSTLGFVGEMIDVVNDYFYERSEASRTRKAVDEAWKMESEERKTNGRDRSSATSDEFVKAVRARLPEGASSLDADVYLEVKSRKMVENLAKDSKVHTRAKLEITEFIPPIPRSAIRLANKLRFVIHVAILNQLLRPSAELTETDSQTAARVGKWVVLTERWPELAWAIALEPGLMGSLEDAAANGSEALSTVIADYPSEVIREPRALFRFLRHGEVLEGHIRELVYLRKVDDTPSLGAARDQIVALFAVQDDALSPADVAMMAGRSVASTRRLMAKMAGDGQLVRSGDAYALADR